MSLKVHVDVIILSVLCAVL